MNSIAEDFEGNLWIGTENRLNLLKKTQQSLSNILMNPEMNLP
ncbi:MAG: hypothetical protein IPL53_04805 [Ignavibacteria bacterium]|nr:hypothetical protein [Ignavibacteria bacterium]